MSNAARTLLAIVVVLAGAALWFALRNDAAAPATTAAGVRDTELTAPLRTTTSLDHSATAETIGDAPAVEMRAAVPSDLRAVIRGRCVDEAGAPLADVLARFWGSMSNSERSDLYRMEHGEPEWKNPPPAHSDALGRFEIRFAPPPPFAFRLSLEAADRAWIEQHWRGLAADSVTDLGDLVLPRGSRVRGAIADRGGAVVREQTIGIRRRDDAGYGGGASVSTFAHTRTDEDGRFAFDRPLPPGRYELECYGIKILEPAGKVAIALPETELRVVVERVADDEHAVISGTIVDPRGVPIRHPQLFVGDLSFAQQYANQDGSFVVKRRSEHRENAIAFGVTAKGYATWRAESAIPWGTRDLRVVLEEGPPLTIRVRRADDHAPIERFGIRFAPWRERGWSSTDDEVLHAGVHEGGVLAFPRATPGRFVLSVVPAESTGLPPGPEREVVVESGVPAVVEVELEPLRERILRVVTAAGAPVAGVRIELLRPQRGGTVELTTLAMEKGPAAMNGSHVAVLVQEATSDADGRATLRGHGEFDYALRMPGPGCVPALVQPFRLDDAGEARIVVGLGATIRGRIEPREVVATIFAESVPPGCEADEDMKRRNRPGVKLLGRGAQFGRSFPEGGMYRAEVAFAEDGRFVVAGIPPGAWQPALHRWRFPRAGSGGGTGLRALGEELALAEGDTRELVLDLSSWLRRPVRVEVRLNDAPHADAISFDGECGTDAKGEVQREIFHARTDEHGVVEIDLPEAEWSTHVRVELPSGTSYLPGPRFAVKRGQVAVRVIADLRTASRTLVMLDPDGSPAAEVQIEGDSVTVPNSTMRGRTDRDGRVTFHADPRSLRLRTRCVPLRDETVYRAWLDERKSTPEVWRRAWLDLGTVELLPGGGEPLTIRLPPEWREMPKD